MTQDITESVIDFRLPVFFKTESFSLLTTRVKDMNPVSLDHENCPVCGVYYNRYGFAQCSSFCNSVSCKSDAYTIRRAVFKNNSYESSHSYDWLVFEANRVVKIVHYLKQDMRSMHRLQYNIAVKNLREYSDTIQILRVMAEISLLGIPNEQDLSVLDQGEYLIEVLV